MIKLYNTLSKKSEEFIPKNKKNVGMYVCGITPYDTTHLGHAFTYTSFDILCRLLESSGYRVNYTQNVTDIDDDILKRAKRDKVDWQKLGTHWTERYIMDMEQLNNIKPTHYVKATETIETIIEIIKDLVATGYAYEKAGNVYFEVAKDSEYGKLSGYSRENMIKLSKERGADPNDPRKKDPLDFILWQKSVDNEPYWQSLWGKGRPGWHIECSAMAYKYIDKRVDIHGGGSDLIYPHHESEIAQSENFTGEKPFAKYWMHTGAVGYQGEKMSKSLGNLVLVSELLLSYSPNAIRYLLLSHHYREPWEYFEKDLKQAEKNVKAIEVKLQPFSHAQKKTAEKEFITALSNDLDTPKGLAILNQSIKEKKLEEAVQMWKLLGFTL